METSIRTNCILLAIAVALSVWAYVFERGPDAAERRGRVFADLVSEDLLEIRVEPGSAASPGAERTPITLQNKIDEITGLRRWRVVSPIDVLTFVPRVEGLVTAILELDRVAPVTDMTDEAIFGAEGPFMTVRFTTRGPLSAEHVLEVGKDHPDAALGLAYFRLDGESVFLTRSRFKRTFNVRLVELRERAVFPVPRDDATRLEITREGHEPLVLARRRGSQRWYLEKPQNGVADQRLMEDLLDSLGSWRIEEFVTDELEDPSTYGLDRPRMTISLTHRRGVTFSYDVAARPASGEVPALTAIRPRDGRSVVRIRTELVTALEKPPEEYRSRFLLQLGSARVTAISGIAALSGERREFRLWEAAAPDDGESTKTPGATVWKVEDARFGATWLADRVLVRTLVQRLQALDVRRYLDGELPPEIAAIVERPDSDVLRLEISLDTEQRPVVVRFFPTPPGEAYRSYDFVALREGDDAEYVLLATSLPRDLSDGGVALRNRVLDAFSSNEIRRIEILARPGRYWSLAQIEGVWRMEEGGLIRKDPEKSLEQLRVISLVSHLTSDFRIYRFLPDEHDLDRIELSEDRAQLELRLTLTLPEDKGFRNLRVGASRLDGEEYYATIDVFEMPVIITGDFVAAILELVQHLDSITLR